MNKFSLAGGLMLLAAGSMFYYWYLSQNGTISCWKCVGTTPVSKTFPKGSICGYGDAIEYPYAFEPTCQPGEDTVTITGTAVWTKYGNIKGPLYGVNILAENTDTGDTYQDISDSDGKWKLDKMELGIYNLTASKSGYKTQVSNYIDWSFPGEWDVYFIYSHLEYLPKYSIFWQGSPQYTVNIDLPDDIAGELALTGVIEVKACHFSSWRHLDIWTITTHGIMTKILEYGWVPWDTFIEINHNWYQEFDDPIVGFKFWGGCGFIPSVPDTPALKKIDLDVERLF